MEKDNQFKLCENYHVLDCVAVASEYIEFSVSVEHGWHHLISAQLIYRPINILPPQNERSFAEDRDRKSKISPV